MSLREDGSVEIDNETPPGRQRWFKPVVLAASACAWMIFWLWLLFVSDGPTWLRVIYGISWVLFALVLRRDLLTLRGSAPTGDPGHNTRDRPAGPWLVSAATAIVIGVVALVLWWFVFGSDGWLFVGLITLLASVSW